MNHEIGKCPKCGKQVDYTGEHILEGEDIGWTWNCSCGKEGTEWHKMEFVEHTVNESSIEVSESDK